MEKVGWLCLCVVVLVGAHSALTYMFRRPPITNFNIASGVGSIFVRDGKVLTVFRQSPTELNNNKHGLIGGLVRAGESVRQGALREIFEEVGVKVLPDNLTLVHTMSSTEGGIETVGHYFLVEAWEGEPYNKAHHKHARIEWVDINKLPSTMIPRNRQAIECMRKGIPYSEYGWN